MHRVLIVIGLSFISFYCFSQQNVPSRIIGRIPNIESTQTYQIQVGAFRITQNANNVFLKLKSNGFNPIYESYFDLIRVLIPSIPAGQVRNHLVRIKSLGFDEVIIREDGNYPLRVPEREELAKDIQTPFPLDIIVGYSKKPLTLDERTPIKTLLEASDEQIIELVINEAVTEMGISAESILVEYILRDNDSQAMAVKLNIKQ
jgi:hypothetical protein